MKRITFLITVLLMLFASTLHAQEAGINPQRLENMTYNIQLFEDFKSITLTDGSFFTDAGVGFQESYVLLGTRGYGDLTGDGLEDAVVFMGINTGGTGTFIHMIPVINDGSTLIPQPAYFLGDRWVILNVSLKPQEITLQVQRHAEDDGFCCPSQTAVMHFSYQNGVLTLVQDVPLWRYDQTLSPESVPQFDHDFAMLNQAEFTPTEVRFYAGTTDYTTMGHVGAGEIDWFNFGASAGQRTTVSITSLDGNVTLQFLDRTTGQLISGPTTIWGGQIPSTGNYAVRVSAEDEAYYLLRIEILPLGQ